jgi:signal peptidase I
LAKSDSSSTQEQRAARKKARRVEQDVGPNGAGGQPAATQRKPKGKVREWTDALLFALVAALIIRAFFFEAFRIPTPSMERNLLVGDFLLVSKLHYGPRMPVTLGIPFTEIYFRGLELPYYRLPGFTRISHGDVVVFNYPVDSGPVDRKTHYIKRVLGMPGDTLQVVDKTVHTNGTEWPLQSGMQQKWTVYKQEGPILPFARLRELGIRQNEITVTDDPNQIVVETTEEAISEIASWPYIERVEPRVDENAARYRSEIFPANSGYTPDQYGPLYVPERGGTATLTEENWFAYEEIIRRFEGREARSLGQGLFEIDGEQTTTYTFSQDYYFMIGDNRDNSLDSRYWGFVPDDHMVGKALMIYFSWSADDNLPRISRVFRLLR